MSVSTPSSKPRHTTPDSVSGALTDAREGAGAPRSGLGGDGKPWRIGTEVYGDRAVSICFTTSLTLTLSPRRGNSYRPTSDCSMRVRQ
ncbi:MAG: hypothetical protein KIS67_26655 [Verrucomicrobiae bacterium]|nr:hypothetical protein [Verrucomicrobiae bacterium]